MIYVVGGHNAYRSLRGQGVVKEKSHKYKVFIFLDTLEGLLVKFFKKLKNKKVLLHTQSENLNYGGVRGGSRGPKFFPEPSDRQRSPFLCRHL